MFPGGMWFRSGYPLGLRMVNRTSEAGHRHGAQKMGVRYRILPPIQCNYSRLRGSISRGDVMGSNGLGMRRRRFADHGKVSA